MRLFCGLSLLVYLYVYQGTPYIYDQAETLFSPSKVFSFNGCCIV